LSQKINYISSLSPNEASGGWSAMNYFIYHGLANHFDVSYRGPVNPGINTTEWYKSKLWRVLGQKGDFFFYSEKRLDKINQTVYKKIGNNHASLFFHGITPWIKVKPDTPYYAYTDATFLTYLRHYIGESQFSKKDIQRITEQEKVFLQGAVKVFFSSQWALEDTIKNYDLKGDNFVKVGLGGNIDYSDIDKDKHRDHLNLLFIALDFEGKGGSLVYAAFKQLKKKSPGVQLTIVGEKPPREVLNEKGVVYVGRLRKDNQHDLERLKYIISESSFLVHPTNKDATPLVIIECGYFGTPAIAPVRFGIPEMIQDGQTGGLLAEGFDINGIVEKVISLYNDKNKYRVLRDSVKKHFRSQYVWKNVENTIVKYIKG